MTEAQTILKMIETVDPSDTDKLDEIDARVGAYIFQEELHLPPPRETTPNHLSERLLKRTMWECSYFKAASYTRSRDALKAIRPEGWFPFLSMHEDHFSYDMWSLRWNRIKSSRSFPTEELAELHAIIQAIEHERSA